VAGFNRPLTIDDRGLSVLTEPERYRRRWTTHREFCVRALERALGLGGHEVFNSDQGSQFTNLEFTGLLEGLGVAISMDGRGRAFDKIFVERPWRTIKYEEVYMKSYETVAEARHSLARSSSQ